MTERKAETGRKTKAETKTEEDYSELKSESKSKSKDNVDESEDMLSGSKKERKRHRKHKNMENDPRIRRIADEISQINDSTQLKSMRDSYNEQTQNLIGNLQKVHNKMQRNRMQGLEFRKKRDQLNKKVSKFKKEKAQVLEKLDEVQNNLALAKEAAKNTGSYHEARKLRSKIIKIQKEIQDLERKIQIENLDLQEENHLVDRIEDLESDLLDLQSQKTPPKELQKWISNVKKYKQKLNEIFIQIKLAAEESQNYHLLYVENFQDVDDLKKERKTLQRELDQNRFIADKYHQRYLEVMQASENRKKHQRNKHFLSQKKVRKEIRKINLQEAKQKIKSGEKLSIFEARAYLESQAKD